jgi:Polyketide cyclase / dehydrase and lipid transport
MSARGSTDRPAAMETGYCLRCQELLVAGFEGRCPRCGLAFDPEDPETYRTHPRFSAVRYWLPGLALAVALGVSSYAAISSQGNMGFALFVAVPFAVGALLGYAVAVHLLLTFVLGVLAIGLIVLPLVLFGFSGIFCGLIGGLVIAGPIFIGILAGSFLRAALKLTRYSQRHYLPILALIALPFGADRLERLLLRPPGTATVTTRAVLDASPEAAWASILFYEEVRHSAPRFLRLWLPRPVRSIGRKDRPGEIVLCLYERGELVKRVTRVEEGRLLAFEVIRQRLHFERDVRLLDGSFEVRPLGDGRSEVSVTTRYERRLRPAWLWEPIERRVAGALHAHVLEGMRERARAAAPPPEVASRPGGG